MKFLSFIEADFFEKADTTTGESKMWVNGIASTGSVDTDKQILLADGFDLSYLKDRGFFNWHHGAQKSSALVVGEPTEAYVRNGQLIVKGFLYQGQPEARNIYNLAKVLQNESSNRRLGFSIEGRTIAKDPNNPNVITKAQITNIAITFMPKNWDTSLGLIVKAEEDDFAFEYEEEPISNTIKEIRGSKSNFLTKSEARLDIFLKYPDIDFNKANEVYILAAKIQEMNVTQEALDAAYNLLGMVAPAPAAEIEKADADEAIVAEDVVAEDVATEDVEIEKADADEAIVAPTFDVEAAVEKLFASKIADLDLISKAEVFEGMDQRNNDLKDAVKTIITGLTSQFESKIEDISKAFNDEINNLRQEPIAPRRTVAPNAILAKGGDEMNTEDDSVLHIEDRDSIKKAMQELVFAGGNFDADLSEASIQYEATGQLPINGIVALRKAGYKVNVN